MKINERMTPKQSIIFVIVIAIAVFIAMQVVYGQEGNTTNSSQSDYSTLDNYFRLLEQQKPLEKLLNYCYQHADRPNPIQDLIDKGFLSSNSTGQTCLSVRQSYNEIQTMINNNLEIQQQKQKEQHEKTFSYNKCLMNSIQTRNMTYEDCYRIFKGAIK
jgi:hypothetical protein